MNVIDRIPKVKSNIIDNTKPFYMFDITFIPDEKDIYHRIAKEVFNKYSYDIFTPAEFKERRARLDKDPNRKPEYVSLLMIYVYIDSKSVKVSNIKFSFSNRDRSYAGRLPIEAYEEIENRFRNEITGTITEIGKNQLQCLQIIYISFKPQQEGSR